jgi:hypothetical protein
MPCWQGMTTPLQKVRCRFPRIPALSVDRLLGRASGTDHQQVPYRRTGLSDPQSHPGMRFECHILKTLPLTCDQGWLNKTAAGSA